MTNRRDQILAATCRVIARDGLRELRVENVAAEAKTSTTLLYYYFNDRAGLVTKTMEYINDRVGTYKRATKGRTGYEHLLNQLLCEFLDDQEVRENSAVWGEIRGMAVFAPYLRPIVKEATNRWNNDLAALISEGQRDQSIPTSIDPDDLASRLTALVEGLSNRWLANLISNEEAGAHLTTALTNELAALDRFTPKARNA